ncbi:hypothetical protein [Bradyrhizobium sp. NP1]|uniref:hypothetical protein n=1 Tax=Bradyrhizobium sp. NP1 TaxID=3049772 RepID=UPI0025A53436|nr:hypothetical protein [Bradyrhizobium sp. NP1]WJR81193.1 hypothetical protein QOU61_15995 [Bradyrhizobium sp. NP1]
MMTVRVLAAAAMLAASLAPSLADEAPHHRHRHHHYHAHHWGLPYPISYLHNYGPGVVPGTFAYYDGPSSNLCFQGAAAYIGQDGRRHPCF